MSYSENFHAYLKRKVETMLSLENEVDLMRKI